MTSENLFDVLEICLQALEQGETLSACLERYPALAEKLRPVLEAAQLARSAAVTEIPAGAMQRGRARVLQAAAELRPVVPRPEPKKSFFSARFYRLAVTTSLVIAFLLTGGTGLVNASNGALPGDQLYPVKRSWEGLRLVFVFDSRMKEELEHQFEQERVEEIEELYTEGRTEQVNFQGVIQTQQNGLWKIGGLEVTVEGETVLTGELKPGVMVQVLGETEDGRIKAEQILLVSGQQPNPPALPATLPAAQPGGEYSPEATEKPEVPDSNEAETPEAAESADASREAGTASSELNSAGEKPQAVTQTPEAQREQESGKKETKSSDTGKEGEQNSGDSNEESETQSEEEKD